MGIEPAACYILVIEQPRINQSYSQYILKDKNRGISWSTGFLV